MDLKITGFFDIMFILIAILVLIIGFKKGFMTKMVKLTASLLVVSLSVFLSDYVAQFFKRVELIYPYMYDKNYNKVDKALQNAKAGDKCGDVLKDAYDCPKFLANYLSHKVGTNKMSELSDATADYLAFWITKIIAFIILLVAFFIILLILLVIIKKLRENEVVKVIDGIFGMLLYFVIYLVTITFLVFLLRLGIDKGVIKGGAYNFIAKDLQLETNKFRIMKYLYNENFFKTIHDLF